MVRLQVNGHLALGKNLTAVSGAISRPQLAAVLTRAAEPMRKRMGDLAPRSAQPHRFGHLADNMLTEVVADADHATVAVGPAWRFWYARYEEYGTNDTTARPFMRPAFDLTQDDVVTILAQALWPMVASAVRTPAETAP